MDNGGCSELCISAAETVHCACGTGKHLNIDNKSCTSGTNAHIFHPFIEMNHNYNNKTFFV